MLSTKQSDKRSIVIRRSERVAPQEFIPKPSSDFVPNSLPAPPPNKIYDVIFGKKTLLILGILSSILALSIALWSLHKNSVLTRRLNSINSSVADLIVAAKTSPVVEVNRREAAKRSRERGDGGQRDRPRVTTEVSKLVRDIERESSQKTMERERDMERMRLETEENIRRMEKAGRDAIAEGSRRKLKKDSREINFNLKELEPPVLSQTSSSSGPAGKVMDLISGASEKFSENFSSRRFADDVDLEDLERDLSFLAPGQ